MERAAAPRNLFRFGLFEADPVGCTLTRNGARVKIQDQPFRLLVLLLERPGEVVTREQLREALWPEGTHVDFDGSLNVILKRLRAALDDDPDNPRFIETIPRRGYRFIAPVSATDKTSEAVPREAALPAPSPLQTAHHVTARGATTDQPAPLRQKRRLLIYGTSAVSFLLLAVAAWLMWGVRFTDFARSHFLSGSPQVPMRRSVAVLGFKNLSGHTEDAWMGTALSEMLSTELAAGEKLRLISGEDVANLRMASPWSQTDTLDRGTTARIRSALNSDVLVLGSYMVIGTGDRGQLRLDVRMQNAKTGEILTEIAEVGGTQDLFRLVSRTGAQLRSRLGVEELQGPEEAAVIAALPLDPEAARFYALGVTKLRQFDALAAKDLLEQAAAADPKFSLVHAMLAQAWAQLGYGQKRREEAKKALDLATDLPRAQRMLVEGEYYESLGKQEGAASVYHALFAIFPDNIDYGLRLTSVLTVSGHGNRAMEAIRQMRALPPPASDDPRLDLAQARLIGDKSKQLTLIRSAINKSSLESKKLVYALAKKEECLVLNYTEHPEQASASCQDAYDVFMSAGNRSAAADCLRMMADTQGTQGHLEQAIATYQQALNMLEGLGEDAKTGAILNNMAIGFENEGKLDRAEQLYRKARVHFQLAGNRDNECTALGNIADILYLRGNLGGAEKLYQEALQITASLENGEPGYLLYRLADLRLVQGRVQDARHLAQQAIDAYPATNGVYQYRTGAMIVFGETLKAGGDLAGARSQFEQTLAIRQKMGALELVAENQVELASLAIEEGHPGQAEPLLRAALAEFEKEKSDPNASSAYTLLSRALLMQGKLDEARKAVARGADLSLTSSDPALKLPAQIQQARVEMTGAAVSKSSLVMGHQRLQSIIATARRHGYHNLEYEARLASCELELKTNSSLAHKHITALASETRSLGLELLARRAEGAMSSGMVESENHSAH
jgi:DNA-binding winged helix-turn-helix (wHTH) protein/tetratricopeptide (TPR) repeat protein/TolB-like protein